MYSIFQTFFVATVISLSVSPVLSGQFVIELDSSLGRLLPSQLVASGVKLDRTFFAEANSYAIFTADNQITLRDFLTTSAIEVNKISEVLFVNSPSLGGGVAARDKPLEGHHVFVIERTIPGVGFFGLEKKTGISKKSNVAVSKLGRSIEWDRSYLTDEGTYCVYRADSDTTIREHGALAGAPISKITMVEQNNYEIQSDIGSPPAVQHFCC